MEIKTKFNIGDKVWAEINGEPMLVTLYAVFVKLYEGDITMLKEKDYCDLELTNILQEVGMPIKNVVATSPHGATKWYSNVTLYEAQKFLREEKKLVVLVGFDFCPITSEIVYNWVIVVNGNTAKKSSYTYDYFEEALSEGIKEAVKILKDGIGE